jgi:hypothetical protein
MGGMGFGAWRGTRGLRREILELGVWDLVERDKAYFFVDIDYSVVTASGHDCG